jgi:CAAX protease family protein
MRTRARGLVAYLLIALGGCWSIWGIAWLLGMFDTSPRGQIIVAAGAFSPAIAAMLVRGVVTREGFADAGWRPHLRNKWPYYLFAWLSPLLVIAGIIALAKVIDLFQGVIAVPPTIIAAALGGAVISSPVFWGEEFGWRGYLQPRLFGDRPLAAAIGTGLAWGIFHYPVILVGYQGYENVSFGLAIFPVFTILQSIILGWLRQRTGSIWASCLGHAAANGIGGSLTAYLFLNSGNFAYLSYAGILAWMPLGVLCSCIVLADQLRRHRAGRRQGSADESRHEARNAASAVQAQV